MLWHLFSVHSSTAPKMVEKMSPSGWTEAVAGLHCNMRVPEIYRGPRFSVTILTAFTSSYNHISHENNEFIFRLVLLCELMNFCLCFFFCPYAIILCVISSYEQWILVLDTIFILFGTINIKHVYGSWNINDRNVRVDKCVCVWKKHTTTIDIFPCAFQPEFE